MHMKQCFDSRSLAWAENTYIVIKATHWTMSNFRQVSRVCADVTKQPHPAWPAWKSAIRGKYLKIDIWRSCFSPFSGCASFLYWLSFIFISTIQLQTEFNFTPSFMVREMILIQLTLLNRRWTLFSNRKVIKLLPYKVKQITLRTGRKNKAKNFL